MKKLLRGNEAVCRGALAAGMRHYFGYPITPQNDVLEFLIKEMPKYENATCTQAESELAAINMVFGAAASGGKTMTTSSSPGVSLMQEGISYLAGAHLPSVILNVVRGGPGLGNIQPSQSDYFQSTRGGGHGDYFTPTYLPASVQEQYDLTIKAFDTAWKYLLPVMIQTDGMLGQMMEQCEVREHQETIFDSSSWAVSGKPESRERNIVRSLFLHPEDAVQKNNEKLQEKYRLIEENEQMWEDYQMEDADFIVSGFGIVARLLRKLVYTYRAQGYKVGMFRPITGYPFPNKPLENIKGKKVLVVEMNYGQMFTDIQVALKRDNDLQFFGKGGGWIPEFEEVKEIADKFFGIK